jgi:cobalt/nickel transport system permease protein
MIDVVGRVDLSASSGTTVWHRASAIGKLLLAALLLALVVFTHSLPLLVVLHITAWTLALSSRLGSRIVATMLLYPLLFGGLFVIASWDGSWQAPIRLLLRPTTACLVATWLVATTPYPDLFAPVSRLLPSNTGDGLFITYRALFELIGRAERLTRALRLRGGVSGPLDRRLAASGESVGTLVLHSFDRSQRLYAAMMLRGHSGRICGCRHYADVTRADWAVAATGVVVTALAAALWRMA